MHKTTRDIGGKNCKTENVNIWSWIGKETNSEIQMEKFFLRDLFASLLCLSIEVLSYTSSTFFKLIRW